MTLKNLALAFSLVAATASLAAQAIPRNPDGSAQTQPQVTAHLIYRALLGRDADPAGLKDTADDVQRGRTRQRIDAIVNGQEFRTHVFGWTPERILTQIYQGLLQRDPDAGAAGWQTQVQQRRYSDVLLGIMGSQEFKNKLAAMTTASTSTPAAATTADVTAAVNCQERVVEEIRNDLTGFVLLRFDAATVDGSAITGAATDISDGGRRLTYRCSTGSAPTYVYDDGRRNRTAPSEGEFANDIVRSCQGEIRTKVQQQRNAANVVFESAGLMPMSADTQAAHG
ncbi:MAG: DUF4214 domain-containing protein, partial [Acidobacteria bacterium]